MSSESALNRRIRSQANRRAFNAWRAESPEVYAEAWPMALLLVATCYKNLTASSRHSLARYVILSALAHEEPERWRRLYDAARATVVAEPAYAA